jgi:hypothetical protein
MADTKENSLFPAEDEEVWKKENGNTTPKKRTKKRLRMYRAYFNDRQCSAPYIAKDDEMALAVGKSRAEFHAKYNKLPTSTIKIIAIDEIEMLKPEKSNKWYIKTPLTMLRAVDLKELKLEISG